MKTTLLLLALMATGLLHSFPAFAEDIDPQDQVQVVETIDQQEVPVAQVTDTATTMSIQVSKSVYTIEETPDVDHMKQALGLVLNDDVKEHILKHGGTLPPEVNPLEGYEHLSDADKVKFQKIRKLFLQNAARVLNSTKFAIGAGSLVGSGLSFIKRSIKKVIRPGSVPPQTEAPPKLPFGERSQRAAQSTLQALDYKLWNQAPLLLDSNEFGLTASVGLFVENGILSNGMGGSEEVGVSFAFNKENKSFVFEIYHNSENFRYTPAIVTAVGVMVKAGPQFGHKNLQSPTKAMEGVSFYPPSLPGYSTSTPDYFSAGFSTSIGYPPNPLVDMMTYTNKMNRNTFLRITVSPVMKGFVRMYFGNPLNSVKLVVYRFTGMYKWIANQIVRLGGKGVMTCDAVHI